MDCVEFSNLLDNYAKLNESQLAELEAHAAECDKCKSELIFFKSIMNTVASLPQAEPPADLLERINSRIDVMDTVPNNINGGIWGRVCFNMRRYSTIAACVVIGIVVGVNNRAFKDIVSFDGDGVINESITTSENIDEHQYYPVPSETPKDEIIVNDSQPVVETKKPVSTPHNTYVPTQNSNNNKYSVSNSHKSDTQLSNGVSDNSIDEQPVIAQNPVVISPTPVPKDISEQPGGEVINSVVEENSEDVYPTPLKEQYTIAQKYHLPDDYPQPTVRPTETTTVANYSINSDKYQIAYGYDLSENKKIAMVTVADQIIINSNDAERAIAILSSFNIQSSDDGYAATVDVFTAFLAELDAEGVAYSHISNNDGADVVPFKLLLD